MPVFEGLFPPPHDLTMQCLLFRLSKWHALAKPRLHTDETLTLLQQSLQHLGDQLHHFQWDTCPAFHTHELPMEAAQ